MFKFRGMVGKLIGLFFQVISRHLSKNVKLDSHMYEGINEYLSRQGEYLNEIAAVYENIYGIDQWWIGLTDLGRTHGLFFDIRLVNACRYLYLPQKKWKKLYTNFHLIIKCGRNCKHLCHI